MKKIFHVSKCQSMYLFCYLGSDGGVGNSRRFWQFVRGVACTANVLSGNINRPGPKVIKLFMLNSTLPEISTANKN